MVKIKLNLVGTGLTIAAGRYNVELTEFEEMPPVAVEKYPYMQGTLKIFGNKNKNLNGRTLLKVFSYSPNALFALRQFLSVNGFTQDVLDNPEFEFDTEPLIGKQYVVDVEINDAGYNSIAFVSLIKKTTQKTVE